jgi:phage gpG-like protein
MPLKGDFGKLDRWAKKIDDLGSPAFRFQVANDMSDIALGLVAQQFAKQASPYGGRWKAKKRPDGRPILRGKTNRLVKWRKAFVNQHGYRIASTAPYAGFHQSGTSRMVARKMVPDRRLPASWSKPLSRVFASRARLALR